MNRKLERNQLKKNFLQEIIIRLDFQGVLQPEMEKVLLIAKPYLKEKSFKRYNEIVNNQTIVEGTSPKDFSSPITYTFMDDNYGFALALSTTSIVMSIQSEVYSPFENYSEIFSYIASLYNEEIDFFTVKRFGLRKINYCFVKRVSDINKYFDSKYFDLEEPISGFDIETINRTSSLSYGKKNLNLRYAVEKGNLDKEPFYKVTLDSDIYSVDKATIHSIIENKDEMASINEMLFTIYCGALTDQMAELLTSENDLPEGLAGVENNE